MPNFKIKVIKIIKSVPHGKVASYGQIAVYAGIPRAARAVGMILNKLPENTKIPWWRIVNNSGKLSIRGSIFSRDDQQSLLQAEGIKFKKEHEFEIEKYRWKSYTRSIIFCFILDSILLAAFSKSGILL